MSQNTTATQPRTVQTADRGKLDVRALVLLAILLAAGFILNFTVGKAISGISGGMISPEFIISAFCLTILVVRPNIGQALVIGLISAAVIQITTTSPFVDFAAEGIAAMLMAGIVNAAGKNGQVKPAIAIVATFLTTFVSGVIFMVIKMAMLGVVGELAAAMLPVVASGEKIHDYILFGYFGKHVNITDGRYVYMRSGRMKSEGHLNNYTLLPLHMFEMFSLKELKEADRTLSDAFSFTKGAPVMKIPATPESSPQNTCYMYDDHLKYGDLLFDLQTDPREENPIQDPAVESRMVEAMSRLLHSSEAPPELYERIDIQ